MIEIPYEMLIESEMLNTQVNFCQRAFKSIDDTIATEGLSDPNMRAIIGASLKYVTASTTRNMRRSVKLFVGEVRNMINDSLKKVLVNSFPRHRNSFGVGDSSFA